MNIKILDSWLREYLDTKATAKEIAEKLSLTSISIERVNPYNKDYVYDIEVTTNRVDLASVVGLAREAAAVLPQFGIEAKFQQPTLKTPDKPKEKVHLSIINDKSLVHRVCAIVMEVNLGQSPQVVQERLEQSDIRSLNNVVDVTNYVMRVIGHPMHVFDYDRIVGHTIKIREAKKGEEIVTLDGKKHVLPGGDIVAEDGEGKIIDLLGIMGLENSVVSNTTKRIVLFLDNNDTSRIRKTSMNLGIRTEAAQLNEKGIDPEAAYDALLYGIDLIKEIAGGVVLSEIIDIYPNKPKSKSIKVSESKINDVIGIEIPLKTSVKILEDLGFVTKVEKDTITAQVPSNRVDDMDIPEDLIEEIARVYGYHNLPTVLPSHEQSTITPLDANQFYWENRIKQALKYWGLTETYTYSFVSEDMFEGPVDNAVELANPLSSDWVYMRKTLIPSLLQVIKENKSHEVLQIFELANVYDKNKSDLPTETRMLAGVIKKPHASFYEIKGLLEQLFLDLGISSIRFTKRQKGGSGADVFVGKERVGEIEVLDENIVNFEVNFEKLLAFASTRKIYKSIAKYPPVVEDIAFILDEEIQSGDVMEEIKSQSDLITEVSLLDQYENSRTFHIVYQHPEKNLTTSEVGEIRKKILKAVQDKFKAEVK